jgi:hypothetical protein
MILNHEKLLDSPSFFLGPIAVNILSQRNAEAQ